MSRWMSLILLLALAPCAQAELRVLRYADHCFPLAPGSDTSDLPALLGRSQPTISHHLSQLTAAGILQREQRGKWAWFRLDGQRLETVHRALGRPGCC